MGGEQIPLTSFGDLGAGIGAARDGKGSALTQMSPGPTHPGASARRGLASTCGMGAEPGQRRGSAPLTAWTSRGLRPQSPPKTSSKSPTPSPAPRLCKAPPIPRPSPRSEAPHRPDPPHHLRLRPWPRPGPSQAPPAERRALGRAACVSAAADLGAGSGVAAAPGCGARTGRERPRASRRAAPGHGRAGKNPAPPGTANTPPPSIPSRGSGGSGPRNPSPNRPGPARPRHSTPQRSARPGLGFSFSFLFKRN